MSLELLVNEIVKPFIQEGVEDPGIFKAVFLAGGPGSGKSYVASELFGIPKKINTSAYGLKLVNQDTEFESFLKKYFDTVDIDNMPDELFRQLTDPTYDDYSGLRGHTKDLSKQRLKNYTKGRLGVVIDGTGHKYSAVKKERQNLMKLGYDTYMVFVNTSLEVAQKRNKERDRVLPPEVVKKYWNSVQKNMAYFQGLFGNANFLLVDNNKTLNPKQAQKKFNMLVGKGIGKFIKKPIKNKQAKKWVEKQRILKKQGVKEMTVVGCDGVIQGDTSKKKVKKNKTNSMSGYKKVTEEKSEIKKVIGVYGGRFQPFGPHHLKTFEWLKKQVDEAYITTSDIKKPPRHPMNYKEKVRHMVKMGVPANRIIKEKVPYVAKNTLKKYDKDTTAVVYIFGKKDAGRLKGGTKKSGGKTYYQDYKKNKNNLEPAWKHGYILTAPHVSISVAGKEVSGTAMRQLLGSPEYDAKERPKLFKKVFGYYDKGVYIMMTNKFKKLFEYYIHLYESSNTGGGSVDDGPGFISSLKKYRDRADIEAGKLGWEIAQTLIDDDYYFSQDFSYVKDTEYPKGPVDSVSFGPAGVQEPSAQNLTDYVGSELWNKWLDHIDMILRNQEYEYVDSMAKERKSIVKDSPKTAKQLDIEEPEETDVNRGNEQHNDLDIVKEVYSLVSDLPKNGRELLLMGGAYGHMSHPFDDKDLTFGDLKNIIEMGLGGQLNREDNVTEKLDGQNLMISWKNGKLITARNKGHLKNKGENALDIKGMQSKFKGRGNIKNAFVFAVKDLQKAISGLSKKQQDKIFGQGSIWMNLEVLWPKSENVVNYDLAEIIFHGAIEYDDSGKSIGQAKGSARMLEGMIRQINQHIQKHYKISKPNFLTVPKHQDFGKLKGKFLGRLKTLQSEYGLKDNDTLALYHQSYWQEWIFNGAKQTDYSNITNEILVKLTKRWAFFDKSYKISQIKKDLKEYPKFLEWVLSTDKNDHAKMVKNNMKPFEELFFEVGATVLKNMDGWMAVNPAKSVQNMRKKLQSAIKDIRSGGDLKKLNTLKLQLDKLNAIGGLDSIVPSEGIVFKYNGKTFKLTGAFASVNQITGLMTFDR